MAEDQFVQQINDKMNHGVSRLSPTARSLYFTLTGAFLSLGRRNQIKISLLKLSENLGIDKHDQSDQKSIIENSFQEIHVNTFVKYEFSFQMPANSNQLELFVSLIDNREENMAIMIPV